ncbi:MAG: putative rane protein, partial [Bryobacterales bacterium]|nr:putative rane protein [Bryobacterales bacterium]
MVLLAATLAINYHTARQVAQFRTNVLWRDQWQFLGELQSVHEGKDWAGVLWSPYWGHRPVVPRLLFYLDARFFSFRNTPLLCISWACLLAQIALIAAVNRPIFGRFVSWRFAAALIVTLNLCLSSFQLENLIWALQVQYTLVIFCAVLSFVLFALSVRAKAANIVLLASCLSAFVGSLTMAQGLLIWPVLALQAWVCRSNRKVWLGLLAIFVVAGGIYAVGYQMPDTGMGL